MTNDNLLGADALKAAFRRHASGISIITGADEGRPFGFTASSATSLGSNPPLVSLNIAQGSSSYPLMNKGRLLGLHVLGSDNLELAQQMAGPKESRFESSYSVMDEGVPVFDSVSAVLFIRIREVIDIEKNAVVVCDVVSGVEMHEKSPITYFNRGYHEIGNRLADNY
jgi:flavin reductase (DIM6/NTAB) family NADH-FMN oxidoreductase RutF